MLLHPDLIWQLRRDGIRLRLVKKHRIGPAEERFVPAHSRKRRLPQFDRPRRLARLEALPAKPLRELGRRRAEPFAPHEGVGAIERGRLAPLRVRLAHHAPEQLHRVRPALHVRHGAQDVGRRAVPSLLERLHGDDARHVTVRITDVHAVQLLLLGRHRPHRLLRHLCLLDEESPQLVRRHLAPHVRRLEQNDRPQERRPPLRRLPRGQFLQLGPLRERRQNGLRPVVAELRQLDRELHHLLVEELRRPD